jgi:hypothetical protein
MANKFDHYGSEESDNNYDFGSLPHSDGGLKKQDTTIMKKDAADITKTMNDSDDSDQMIGG